MSELLDTPPATPSPPPSGGAPVSSSPPLPSASEAPIIAERYRLLRKLGEGAMGAVYLAEHVHMRKRFALKLLLPEAMASPEIVARFEREAIAAGNINHPGVCAATDFGRLSDGSFFLVLEYVDGQSLRSAIARGGPMSPARAVGIARQILLALGAAHSKGVVHRDIKPENVMLASNDAGSDVVKVLDFGIAKIDANSLGEAQGTALTRMGAIYGTPSYMAPEQAMGRPVDHRADLYAVGVMLHEMIAGEPPFDGEGVVILAKHVNEPPPLLVSPYEPQSVSPDLRAFVARLLAKKPEDRPESAQQAVAELDQVRASLVSFEGVSPMSRTQIGAGAVGSAATVIGEPTPSPVPVVTSGRSPLLDKLAPLAKRVGLAPRDLAIALGIVSGLLVVLLLVVLLRPSHPVDDDEPTKPKHHATAGTSATATAKPTSTATATAEPTAEPTSSAGGNGGGGGTASNGKPHSSGGNGGGGSPIKQIGRKIKGLF